PRSSRRSPTTVATRAGRRCARRWWLSPGLRRARWPGSSGSSASRCRAWPRVRRAMTLRERIGVDLGGRRRLEDGLAWAAASGVHYVDMCLEGAPDHPNAPGAWTPDRVAAMRAICERHRIHLGLHSASAVNAAETSPARPARPRPGGTGAPGGYHCSGDYAARRVASLERLQRAAAHAERAGARLLLETLNREPEHAEIRYLAHNLEECREYFGRIQSPSLGWAVTVNHAHLVPQGVGGVRDAMHLG